MTTIRNSQLIKHNSNMIPLPQVGERVNGKTIKAVRPVGRPRRGLHNGQHYGVIQSFEMDIA